MTFTDSIKSCLNKYATFRGRAPRSEYWWFWLFCVLVEVATTVIFGIIGYLFGKDFGAIIAGCIGAFLSSLLLFLPLLAVLVRRLHDTNYSGWWSLLYVGLLITSEMERSYRNSVYNEWIYLISLILLVVIIIWLLVLLLKDSDEENQYGLPVY